MVDSLKGRASQVFYDPLHVRFMYLGGFADGRGCAVLLYL